MGAPKHNVLRREPSQRFELEFLPTRPGFEVRPALEQELPAIIRLTEINFPGLVVDEQAIADVHRVTDGILAISNERGLVGATAFLPLNATGFASLLAGRFPTSRPDLAMLAEIGQPVAAIYSWALCVPGSVVGAMGQVMEWMRRPSYIGRDIYACPGTPAGGRFMAKIGFAMLDCRIDGRNLWVYRRPVSQLFPAQG